MSYHMPMCLLNYFCDYLRLLIYDFLLFECLLHTQGFCFKSNTHPSSDRRLWVGWALFHQPLIVPFWCESRGSRLNFRKFLAKLKETVAIIDSSPCRSTCFRTSKLNMLIRVSTPTEPWPLLSHVFIWGVNNTQQQNELLIDATGTLWKTNYSQSFLLETPSRNRYSLQLWEWLLYNFRWVWQSVTFWKFNNDIVILRRDILSNNSIFRPKVFILYSTLLACYMYSLTNLFLFGKNTH